MPRLDPFYFDPFYFPHEKSPIGIQIFSSDDKAAESYPSQEEILNKLSIANDID